jgi:hypothetical protein
MEVGIFWQSECEVGMAEQEAGKADSIITCRGTVVAAEGEQPIPGALVKIAVPGTDMRHVRKEPFLKLYQALTDPQGAFSIELPIGNSDDISIDAFFPGFRSAAGTFCSGGDWSLHKMKVSPGVNVDVTIRLPKALYVAGVVRDKAGQPIANVDVHAGLHGPDRSAWIASTLTDSQGRFEVFDFPEKGNFDEDGYLAFRSDMFAEQRIDNIYDVKPAKRSSLVITMDPGITLRGTIKDEHDKPAAGIAVELQSCAGYTLKRCTSDEAGSFVFYGLIRQCYTLYTAPDEMRRAEEGAVYPQKDMKISMKLRPIKIADDYVAYDLLGMKVADNTSGLKAQYDTCMDKCVVVVDPGTQAKRLGLGDLAKGNAFWIVGHQRPTNLREMISEILRINAKPVPAPGEFSQEGFCGRVRVVYHIRGATHTAGLKLTEADARQVRELGRELGMPDSELYEGVVTGDSQEELNDKKRADSWQKMSKLGKSLMELARKNKGRYPAAFEDVAAEIEDIEWCRTNVTYIGKGKRLSDKRSTVIALDKGLAAVMNGTVALFNDGGYVDYLHQRRLAEFGITIDSGKLVLSPPPRESVWTRLKGLMGLRR